jgi:tetratricopeptide (TPR) repeat protein
MEQALKVSAKPDETHFNYSKLIYQKEIYMSDAPYDGWSLDKALDEARQAEQINPLDVYRHQQALILYAQKKFREAYDIYCRLFQGDLRSAELFYEAMACQKQLGDTTAVMALLDSCVATFSRPYLKEAAPYLLTRASTAMDYGRYRQAVSDLNEYEQLMAASINDQFYYLRYRACLNSRQYQLALNDIDKAITMAPRNDLYYSEKASLQVRVGLYDEAMETARQCIAIAPDHSDGYLFLGLAQCLKGQKAEGVKRKLVHFECLERAIPRNGYEICDEAGNVIGNVTSGIMLPNTKVGIGMGYIQTPSAKKENIIYIKIREKLQQAKIV